MLACPSLAGTKRSKADRESRLGSVERALATIKQYFGRRQERDIPKQAIGGEAKMSQCDNEGIENCVVVPSHGCAELVDWEHVLGCYNELANGCSMVSTREEHWLKESLDGLQPDKVGKWRKKTSKGKKKSKLPRKTDDGCILLDRWVCNGSKKNGCKAQVLLLRNRNGHLSLLTKEKHTHDQRAVGEDKGKRGLPLYIRVELAKYVESDLVVPKIMRQLETGGVNLDGITKKMVRNHLIYQRRKRSGHGTLGEVKAFIATNMHDPTKEYQMDEVFIVDAVALDHVDEVSFFQQFKMSLSCPQMVEWAKAIATQDQKQMTLDATFKIFTGDKFILLASGVTSGGNHWYPILYSVVPVESQDTTVFHLESIWKMLGTLAPTFFDNLFVLKDAGAGLHCGVRAFFEDKACKWSQQDCYAHLSRVDGNLQQACKKYGIASNLAVVIAKYIKQISFAPNKVIKQQMLEKFEDEFATFKEFLKWWKSTYGGPFQNWARCDAPQGFPVSNQGHESNNRTFKKVHMPSRATQRRMDTHKALKPLFLGISSLVREKEREYTFTSSRETAIGSKLWEDVDMLLMSADWALRQQVESFTLLPTPTLLECVYTSAQKSAQRQIEERLVHSNIVKDEFLRECETQVQILLKEKARQFLTYGLGPTTSESLKQYCKRRSEWVAFSSECTCFHFIDNGTCKHILSRKVTNGEVSFPVDVKILHRSRTELMKMQYVKSLTRKQSANLAANEQRKKRYKAGVEELEKLTVSPTCVDPSPAAM